MPPAWRFATGAPVNLAAMCSLACDSLLARCSGLQVRPISHLISLRSFKRLGNPMHSVPQQQPPPLHELQQHSCRWHAQHRCFAAAALPQQVEHAAAAGVEAPGQQFSGRPRAGAGGSHSSRKMAERLEELASVQSAHGASPAAAWERQPSHSHARKQRHKGGGSRSKRRQGQRQQDASDWRPSPAAKSHQSPPLPALASSKDPNAIRSQSLIHNSDIPSHAWTVMRRLKDAGGAHTTCSGCGARILTG